MIYTVTFNPAIDYVVHLDKPLKAGQLHRNTAEDFQFGGKGINVSNVLRTLGLESTALGFVAGFTGDALEQGLNDMGLPTAFLHVEKGMTRINVKIRGEEESEINGMGPEITPEDFERLMAQLEGLTARDVLVLSGSIPACLPADSYERILRALEGKNIPTVVDASGALLRKVLPHRPFLIKPNHHELAELFGKGSLTEAELVECARALQKEGARNVLISMAGEGAMLVDERGDCHRAPCPRGTVVNSVGAGDSMVAGFLAGWLESGSYEQALRLGIAAGSACAFSLGLPTKAEIDRLRDAL